MKTGSLDLNTHDIFSTHLPQNERIKQNSALMNGEKPSLIETNDRDDHGSVAITHIESPRSSSSTTDSLAQPQNVGHVGNTICGGGRITNTKPVSVVLTPVVLKYW